LYAIVYNNTGIALILHSLQLRLESIYDIQTHYDIKQFTFHDPEYFKLYRHASNSHEASESLFIRETSDGMDLSLYLEQSILQALIDDNPFDHLHQGNLNNFCVVVEGISHFVYLVWNATHRRTVSQLELELQAEIDKYILSASILASQSKGMLPENLCELLFDNISFELSLDSVQKQRYVLANNYARQYCTYLHHRLLRFGESNAVTKEIRRFYRLWHKYKFKRIRAMTSIH